MTAEWRNSIVRFRCGLDEARVRRHHGSDAPWRCDDVVAGRLVMAGATPDTIKAMPEFSYAPDTAGRDAFVAAADKDITRGRAAVAGLERKAGAAGTEAKTRIDADIGVLQADVNAAEGKLSELKQATSARWKEFEADVSAATARLRKSTEKARG